MVALHVVATVLLHVAVLDVACAYVELALLQCDPHDQRQLWSMPSCKQEWCKNASSGAGGDGLARGGALIHQSTKLCLMPQDCDVDAETPLVLDDCNSSCVQNDPAADIFVLHHNQGVAPRALESRATWVGADYPPPSYRNATPPRLFVTASSHAPAVALMPWNAKSPVHQQWMSATPFEGPDHILQVGAGEGEPLCRAIGRENNGCCLGVLDDGWGTVLARFAPMIGAGLLATVVAGVVSKRLRKRKADCATCDGNGDRGLQEPHTSLHAGPAPHGSLFDPLIATDSHDVGTKSLPQDRGAEDKLANTWVPVPEPPQLVFDGSETADGQVHTSGDATVWGRLETSIEVNGTSDNIANNRASPVGAGATSNDTVSLATYHANLSVEENAASKQEKSEDLACVQTEVLWDDCTRDETLGFAAEFPGYDDGLLIGDMETTAWQVSSPAALATAPVKPRWGPSGAVVVAQKYCCPFPGCGHTTDRAGHLTDHIKIHTGEKPYACPYPGCTYRSTARGHITRHVRSHTKEKPYRCTYPGCEFASSQSNHVTTHMRKHTGERPFRCDVAGCDYASARAWLVTRHKATRHGISGDEASTVRDSTSVETHPASDFAPIEHAEAASAESVAVCGIAPKASTPSPPPLSQLPRTQTHQVVQATHAVAAAKLPLGASAAAASTAEIAAVGSTTAVYAKVVVGEEDPALCEQWQVELSPGVWSNFPMPTMRMFSSAQVTGVTSMSLSARGRDYTLDLTRMVQRNDATGTTRKIRRLEAPRLAALLQDDPSSGAAV